MEPGLHYASKTGTTRKLLAGSVYKVKYDSEFFLC